MSELMPELYIHVHPRSKKPRIQDVSGVLHVYVSEPAHESKANLAVLSALAKHLHLAKSKITIASGHKSKEKKIRINI